jgi:HAD superfamily hydrolase (TIGR01509 family)
VTRSRAVEAEGTRFLSEHAENDEVPLPPGRRTSNPSTLPKVVLFDMDDTVFDHSLTCRDALAALRRETGHFRARSLVETWREYDRLLDLTHTDVMLGRRTSDDVRTERFLRLAEWAGRPVDAPTAREFSRTYRAHYQRLRRPVPGAPEILQRLRGRTRLGIVTNNTRREQEEKLEYLGLTRSVDFLVTSEEVGVAKPDPAIFRVALERAEARPAEAVMIGDSWGSDVLGARAAGIPAVWFNRFRKPRPEAVEVPEFTTFRASRRFQQLLATQSGPPDPRPRKISRRRVILHGQLRHR